MSVGLNYATFKRYLEWMLDRGLVAITTEKDRHEYIRLTSKGVDAYHKLVLWIEDVIGD